MVCPQLTQRIGLFMKQNVDKHMNVHQSRSVGNWEAIFKAVHDLIMILDIDNRIIDANPAVFETTGLREDQVLGQFCYKIFHCSEKPPCGCPYEKLKKSHHQESCTMEMEALGRKYLVTVAPVFEGEGKQVTKIVHIAKDITDLKKAEAARLDSEKKFQVIFDAASDGILVADIVDKKFVDANRSICEMLGYTRDELCKLDVSDIHPQEDLPRVIEVFEKQAKREIVLGVELPVKQKDGSIFYADISSRPVKLGGRQFLIGIFRDVTLRLQTEKQIQKNKKLESLGTLAGGIAHDFNNILSAILGNINLVLFDTRLLETTRNLLAESEKASLRAKDLVQQLLTFSKGGDPIKETAALDTVVKDSANFVLHGDKVACQYNISEDIWLVDIDKGQISQVIQNIVINARQAMPEGGIIEISCENVSSTDKKILPNGNGEKFVKISIKDSGVGIPEKLLDRMFDPYFSTKQDGSGLGLAICQSIISKHNGNIFVESVPGEGTTFTIYLPASDKTKTQEKATVGGQKPYSPVKILIMDDEEMLRNVAKAMLTKLGNTVVLAADGVEAVKCYQQAMNSDNPIQLVIMDLNIPGGMGGKEAVQEIHKLNPEAKVIVSSGYSNDPVMANFKKYGFCATIAKPFQLQDLSRVLSHVLA